MRIAILTLFPDIISSYLKESIIQRAIEKGIVEINIINIRDFSPFKSGQVDDTPYGGGSGMVLMCEPVFKAIDSVKTDNSKVIMMTPTGEKYNQSKAIDLTHEKHIILLCGHYEGFDERIKTKVDLEISIGDYVLTGGELASLVITDSVVRLLEGVITDASLDSESFTDGLLDYPVYTKPRVYEGLEVPEVLLSGDHKKIDEYRLNERIRITKEKRPDILK